MMLKHNPVTGHLNLWNEVNKGGDTITRSTIWRLRNTMDESLHVYSPVEWYFLPNGSPLYANKDCTQIAGRITYNMSGACTLDTYPGVYWTTDTTEEYVSSDRLATEQAVVNEVQTAINQANVAVWNENSNLNNYKSTGVYRFAGYRKNQNDGLPITNVDTSDKCNVAFTLIVDRKDGYYQGNMNIPDVVSQTLFLANRQGSETKIYTRHYQYDHWRQREKWEPWREMIDIRNLGTIMENFASQVLDAATENGYYMGVLMHRPTPYVFKLEVINNYALADALGYPAHVMQTMTGIDVAGSVVSKRRIAVYQNDAWTWGAWTTL